MQERQQLERLAQVNVYAFVRLAFLILHPGTQFKNAPHVDAICFALQRIALGECKRLIITVPPRYLKSVTVAVAFCAWWLGHNPNHKIMVANYSQTIAAKHGRMFRALVRSAQFKRIFPAFQIGAIDTVAEMETSVGGGRKTASLDGSTTGFGANVLIIDDLMKPADARSPTIRENAKNFFDETLFSRLEDKENGIIIAIQQRLHEDDIINHLLQKAAFEHLNLPAIAVDRQSLPLNLGNTFERYPGDALAPEIESLETLANIRAMMGDPAFSAQYQQDPTPPGGNRIRWEWFPTYNEPLPRQRYEYVVQSIDTAHSDTEGSDYSVCLTLALKKGKWHLLDVYRRHRKYFLLKREMLGLFERWAPDKVLIEEAGVGWSLVDDMREAVGSGKRGRIITYVPTLDKETRVEVQCVKLEDGLVWLPEMAPWRDDFRKEILGFPNAAHDDQVDALTQFLEWLSTPRGRGSLAPRGPDGRKLTVSRRDHVRRD
ncbi:phage terminase large subunit [Novosphingobium sp.]|uniref:phage terminase large subunit n=1 Tax=Novosphingobium sp. TaxID=1874826 RepID=UPI003D151918